MLRWIRKAIGPRARRPGEPRRSAELDRCVLWAAVCTMFFFLLRAGEALHSGGVDGERILRADDLAFRGRDGELASPGEEVERVDIQFRKTKADQNAFGATRTHYRSGEELCVVTALVDLRDWAPERFRGAEGKLPAFRWSGGGVVKREEVQEALQKAARAVGLPAGRFMSHSLRIGGASALYHATGDIEVVKRLGRWSSGAFHAYLWESADQARGVAAKMATDEAAVHYT